MSIPKEQTNLTSTVDRLLERNDLDFLKEEYENKFGISVPFTDCKRHYIKHLLALIAAHSFQVIDNSLKLSPPLHVDALWHFHILETSRYREFEKIVLEAYRQSGRETSLQHLEHSVVDNKVGREERIKKTRGFYETLGLVFVSVERNLDARNLSDEIDISLTASKRKLERNDQDDSSVKKLKETSSSVRKIGFYIEDKDGNNRFRYNASSTARFEKAADMYAQFIGKKVSTLRFFNRQDFYCLHRIAGDERVGQVFEDDEEGTEHIVVALPEQTGC